MPKPIYNDLSIAVPVYSRPNDLRKLLQSVFDAEAMPGEVLLCEDMSAERPQIREIANEWAPRLAELGCELRYVENVCNLGYDGNVRNLFALASRRWVCLLGNDDLILPSGVAAIRDFVEKHPEARVVSRAHVRVEGDRPVGVSRHGTHDHVVKATDADSGRIFRLAGFVGGLVIDRAWATSVATDRYDGTLYYQIYLAALAFTGDGIGYISTPTVGGRAGNPPLFGSAGNESAVHVPGSYTPKGRAAMWRGALKICADVEACTGVPILAGVRRELTVRQSFHVFEMMGVQGRRKTLELVQELRGLGLMGHPLPWALAAAVLTLGKTSGVIFWAARRSLQH